MSNQPPITAVLVAYNSAGVIASAIESVLAHPLVARVVVVDNASSDHTAEFVIQTFPKVDVIRSGENLGFGRGNNLALATVTTPFALLLNPDAAMKPEALETLLEAAQHYPEALILAPQLVDEQNQPYPTMKRSVFVREADSGSFIQPEGACCAEFISGAVWLLRCEPFRQGKDGFFDPGIFLYYEDDDLCLRACAMNGSCVLVPQARAYHGIGKSSVINENGTRFRHRHMAWSRLYVERKYQGHQSAQKLRAALRRKAMVKYLWYRLRGDKAKAAKYAGQLEGIEQFT